MGWPNSPLSPLNSRPVPSLCEVDVIDNGSFAEQALEQKRTFENSV